MAKMTKKGPAPKKYAAGGMVRPGIKGTEMVRPGIKGTEMVRPGIKGTTWDARNTPVKFKKGGAVKKGKKK